MSWTLTHRFLNAAGRPASGWVYFDLSTSPTLTDTGTFVGTADRVRLDRQGAFTISGLPSEPDLFLIVYPRIASGDPSSLGPVAVPMQPDGTTIDLDQLVGSWPAHPVFVTRAEWDALLARVAALEVGGGGPGGGLEAVVARLTALEAAVAAIPALQAAIAAIILRLDALEAGGPPPDTGGAPVNPLSSWGAARVAHGQGLDPALGKKTGLPPGWAPAATLGATRVETPGAQYVDTLFTGRVTVVAPDVSFIRCRFTAAGYTPGSSPGTEFFGVIGGVEAAGSPPKFIDCEFQGGAAISANTGGDFDRCHFTGGVDLVRLSELGPVTLTECVLDGMLAADAGAHVDAFQATTTQTGRTLALTVLRSWIRASEGTGLTGSAYGNAAMQFGSFGASSAAAGTVTDSYLDGGGYVLSVGGQTVPGKVVTYAGNTFGRSHRWGVLSSTTVPGVAFGTSNIWADTRTPVLPGGMNNGGTPAPGASALPAALPITLA